MRRALLGAVVVLLAAAQPAAAQEESEIRSVVVEATVNPDGSMDVVETLAYDFTAERNGGFRTFVPDPANYQIVDFEVTEDGERRDLPVGFDDPNSGGQVRWFGSGDRSKVTGRHDYTLTYTVEGAIDVFPDVAVLNWQFIGVDFPQLDEVRVDITFPGDGTDLRAFAHGVLHGVVEPLGNEVSLRVADNPAGQFVETRILLPPNEFTVAPTGPPSLERILAEERAFADAANAQRAEAREIFEQTFNEEVEAGLPGDCDGDPEGDLGARCATLESLLEQAEPRVGRELTVTDGDLLLLIRSARADVEDEVERLDDERNRAVFNVVGPIAAVAGAVAAWLVWRTWGKDPEKPSDIGEYYRELPAESPAVVASIDDWGGVDSKSFAATLVDLAQRGWLVITPEGDDHRFTRTDKAEGEPLKDYEAAVLWRLFPVGRHTVTQDELTSEAKASRSVSAAWLSGFRSQVKADYDAQGYQARTGCVPWLLHLLVVITLGAVTIGAFALQAWVGAVAAAVVTVLLVLATPLLRKRTEKGARKLAEVNGLKKFLEDFSLVDDVPVGHLALYERYLVYAVALGVAQQLINGLRMRFPAVANDATFAPWYGYYAGTTMHAGGNIDRLSELGSLDSFAGDFTRATAAAFSPPSSSGGSGGGFSGGGGSSGGGGGGGAGSW